VAPFSGYATGVLAEFIAALLPAADVLVTDWTDARLVPRAAGRFDLDAQTLAVLDALRTHGGPAPHVVALSQGVVPALAAVALAAAEGIRTPRSLSLLGGPVDPRRHPTPLDRLLAVTPPALLETHLLSVVPPRFPGRGRLVYPGLLQLLTYAAHNAGLYLHAQAGLLAELAAGRPDGYARLHAELHGVADVPGELFAQGLRTVYRDAALPRGAWSIRGREVEPGRIGGRTALLTVEAGRDELVGAGQTHGAHDLCPAVPGTRRARLTLPGAGHVDLFKGPAFRARLAPALLRFIAASDGA
jgi:poly(3-hydroxybutyrate) depolymerase